MEKLKRGTTMKVNRDENGKLTGVSFSENEGIAIIIVILIFTQFTIRLIQALVR